jgi:MFS family permease
MRTIDALIFLKVPNTCYCCALVRFFIGLTLMDKSYRALLAVPYMGPLLVGMQIARIAQSMVGVTIVLYTLAAYDSPALSGLATFFSIFPGLLVSPLAGALLDRHGRTRLVALDYLIALLALASIGILALLGMLPPWLLIVIAALASLTAPLSATGLRSLFPLIVPNHLWERVNAVDSTGYVVAIIVGPPFAAGLVSIIGGPLTFIVIGLSYGFAAIVIARAKEPPITTVSTGRLMTDALQGLIYTWRNRTLRGLGFSISVINLANGTITIVVPLLVLQRLQLDDSVVGLVFALQGLAGVVSAFAFGRMDSLNRERVMLAIPMIGCGIAMALVVLNTSVPALGAFMVVTGLLNGPIDIALFTLRQRRTDPSWAGRAYAVSMSFNYSGIPVGAAIAGGIAARSIDSAILFGAVTCLVGGILAVAMIPPTAE